MNKTKYQDNEVLDKITNCEINFDRASIAYALSEDFIRTYKDKVNWFNICNNNSITLSRKFIVEHLEYINTVSYMSTVPKCSLDIEILELLKNKINWNLVYMNQTLPEDFIENNFDIININGLLNFNKLSEGFILKHFDLLIKDNFDVLVCNQVITDAIYLKIKNNDKHKFINTYNFTGILINNEFIDVNLLIENEKSRGESDDFSYSHFLTMISKILNMSNKDIFENRHVLWWQLLLENHNFNIDDFITEYPNYEEWYNISEVLTELDQRKIILALKSHPKTGVFYNVNENSKNKSFFDKICNLFN